MKKKAKSESSYFSNLCTTPENDENRSHGVALYYGDDGASGGANLREQSEVDVVLDEVAFFGCTC